MKKRIRQACHIAHAIRGQLMLLDHQHNQEVNCQAQSLVAHMQRLDHLTRRLSLAQQHSYHGASQVLHQRLRYMASELSGNFSDLYQVCISHRHVSIPAPSEVLADLNQIEEEFGQWSFDAQTHVLSVVTEAIELESVYLGPFRIELSIKDVLELERTQPYTVVALDPHPAAEDSIVTHPHISNEKLCEGDAMTPICSALETGRLCDFFLLIRSVLMTYNNGSPYVSLDKWYGGPNCDDCGTQMDSDEAGSCGSCETDLCDDCSMLCESCHTSCCHQCTICCPSCQESCCEDCARRCDDCERKVCPSCLTECTSCQEAVCDQCFTSCHECEDATCRRCLEEDDLCPSCNQTKEPDHETNEEENQATPAPGSTAPDNEPISASVQPAQPALQPHRMGEAAVVP